MLFIATHTNAVLMTIGIIFFIFGQILIFLKQI